jgi:hypothetical protein
LPDFLVVVCKIIGPGSLRRQLNVLRPQSAASHPDRVTNSVKLHRSDVGRSPLHGRRNNERKSATATLLVIRPGLIEAGP